MSGHRLPSAGVLLLAAAATILPATPSSPAAAEDRPPQAPTRDVAVTYRMAAGAAASEMRIAWLTAEQRMRLDMPGQGYMVVDQRGQRAFMVMDSTRMVMEIPFAQNTQRMAQLPQGARLAREGQDRVAGTPCTVWTYQEGGRTGRTITADGVVLRVTSPGGPEESMEATEIAYDAQDPARFRPPAGYTALAMPSLTGGSAVPGAAALPPGVGMPTGAAPSGPFAPPGFGAAAPVPATSSGTSPPAAKPPNAVPQRTR
jgi:Domain of unknown function (DUF4412)